MNALFFDACGLNLLRTSNTVLSNKPLKGKNIKMLYTSTESSGVIIMYCKHAPVKTKYHNKSSCISPDII